MKNQQQQKIQIHQLTRVQTRELARAVDKVCFLILCQDCPQTDIEIAKNDVRRLAQEFFPEKMELFEMIYESRWSRLQEQFRN